MGGCISVSYFSSHKRFVFKCSLQQRVALLCFYSHIYCPAHGEHGEHGEPAGEQGNGSIFFPVLLKFVEIFYLTGCFSSFPFWMRQSSLGDLVFCLFLKTKIVGFSYVSVSPMSCRNISTSSFILNILLCRRAASFANCPFPSVPTPEPLKFQNIPTPRGQQTLL